PAAGTPAATSVWRAGTVRIDGMRHPGRSGLVPAGAAQPGWWPADCPDRPPPQPDGHGGGCTRNGRVRFPQRPARPRRWAPPDYRAAHREPGGHGGPPRLDLHWPASTGPVAATHVPGRAGTVPAVWTD